MMVSRSHQGDNKDAFMITGYVHDFMIHDFNTCYVHVQEIRGDINDGAGDIYDFITMASDKKRMKKTLVSLKMVQTITFHKSYVAMHSKLRKEMFPQSWFLIIMAL